MIKILLAIENIEQNYQLYQILTKNSNLDVKITTDGFYTLNEYSKFKPDIFILDVNLQSLNYINIIDTLSLDINEKLNCNIILFSNIDTDYLTLSNLSKIYKAFFKNYKYTDILETVSEMSNYIIDKKIDTLFLKLHIPFQTPPSNRVKNTLLKCYNSPELLGNLNNLFNLVGYDFGTDGNSIRSSFRTTLSSLNQRRYQNPSLAIYKLLFSSDDDLTPKSFLDICTYYLKYTKK